MPTTTRVLQTSAAVLAAAVAALALWPIAPLAARPPSHPATNFADAVQRFDALRAAEPGGLDTRCGSLLLSHGERTSRVVVLIHGFTNCPWQFEALAETLYATGDNVLLMRLPEHGFTDRKGPTLGRMTAESVLAATYAAIDVADGLGDSVLVAGLSVGAVAAAWAGQERTDVRRAVMIAPMFGLGPIPAALSPTLSHFWRWWPDTFCWWNRHQKDQLPGPTHCYWGWSSRGMSEMLRLAVTLQSAASRSPARAGEMVMVTNANDVAVDNRASRTMLAGWRKQAPGRAREYEFAKSLGLGHDLIDPGQPYQRIEIVYPVLVQLLHEGLPAR